jgi:hypothetical protein
MGTKKINIQSLLMFFFMSFTSYSNSQELFTKKLNWNASDSVKMSVFQSTDQIIEWGKNVGPFVTVQSEKICIRNNEIFILKVDKCSGIYCPSIYIFKEKNGLWQLVASTDARLKERIEIIVDNKKGEIIFKTKSSQIGELPFETLNLSSDKAE